MACGPLWGLSAIIDVLYTAGGPLKGPHAIMHLHMWSLKRLAYKNNIPFESKIYHPLIHSHLFSSTHPLPLPPPPSPPLSSPLILLLSPASPSSLFLPISSMMVADLASLFSGEAHPPSSILGVPMVGLAANQASSSSSLGRVTMESVHRPRNKNVVRNCTRMSFNSV